MVLSKNKNLTKTVVKLLTENYTLRDDWISTVKGVHDIEMKTYGIVQQDYYYAIFHTTKLSNIHTIRRIWQHVQEHRVDLRGKNWEERQRHSQTISKEISATLFNQLNLFETDNY